ncbi:putative lipase 2 [Zopfia rhizophila CBS 207.26]|uniref:Putative lipase 2 n=1 Tax=Zopfia rhizophila CBS 207.26 TaxID=1314779 RepID=A0A6A6E0V6_9PEZI|nr:putative lipase 2 [Zopfia rhizophila CBS 207.26]
MPPSSHNQIPGHGGPIDLGYTKHIPTFVNTTLFGRRVSIYKNVRFTNPPTGDLRFQKPDTDLPNTQGIQDGHVPWGSADCITSAPAAIPFPDINGTAWGHEDCLFLDVYVPKGVQPGDQVPVLHYFIGTPYAFGSKEMFSNPMGLFDSASEESKTIFVVDNYRLGMPGWMYVPGFDMDANLGVHDCLVAVKWTSKYIYYFGGDSKRVTVVGQSNDWCQRSFYIYTLPCHNSLANGTLMTLQAIISSPDIPSRRNVTERQQDLFQYVLNAANCTSLRCLRSVPEEVLLRANDVVVSQLPSTGGGGVFGPVIGFGPVPDGQSIPDIPEALSQLGKYHKEIRGLFLTPDDDGANQLQGNGTSPDTNMPEGFPALLRRILPTASNETIATIRAQYAYSEPPQLTGDWTTDVIYGYNAYNVANAFRDRTRRYIMPIPPGTHGQDVFYYFYYDQNITPVADPSLALEFRQRVLKFVHGAGISRPVYGTTQNIFNVADNGFESTPLLAVLKSLCEMINKVVLDRANGA